MAGSDRARRVRAFAKDLETRFDGVRFEPTYDSGPKWRLEWTDGPCRDTVRAVVDAAGLAGTQVLLSRSQSRTAIALTTIRLAAAGRLGRFDGDSHRSGPLDLVEWEMDRADFPERPSDELEQRLAQRLLAIATTASRTAWTEYESRPRQGFRLADVPLDVEATAATLIRDHGLGWLVADAIRAGVEVPPLSVLSATYAAGADAALAEAWRERAQPLPVRTAVAAAIADDHLTEPGAAALLALLPELRAELARTEAAAREAARRAGLTPEQLGAALDGSDR